LRNGFRRSGCTLPVLVEDDDVLAGYTLAHLWERRAGIVRDIELYELLLTLYAPRLQGAAGRRSGPG
jgi:hypothetical protein